MKVAGFSSLFGLVAATSLRLTYGAREDFAKLLTLLDQVRQEVEDLVDLYDDKEADMSKLLEECNTFSSSSWERRSPGPTPAPGASSATTTETESGPEPMTHTTTSSTTTASSTIESSRPKTVSWTPRIGDTWNYNLATPVDIATDVDVFFIDMGEQQLDDRSREKVGAIERWSLYIVA